MPFQFGPFFPFRRDNRKPDGTWDAPDATDENIKGTSVDPYEPRWPRWKQKPPLHGEGEFISNDPYFDIDEIRQTVEFYPPGRPLVDKNADDNPASRQRVGDMPGGNFHRRRLIVSPYDSDGETLLQERDGSLGSAGGDNAQIQLVAAQSRAPRAGGQRRVYTPERQADNRLVADAYLREPKVRAFLDTIAWAEGADYDVQFGGRRFADYSRFPSTGGAAGRYQFLRSTYDELSPKLGVTDFTPRSQDLMAVQYMIDRGIINQVVAGNLEGSLPAGSHIWASLPENPTARGYYDKPQYGNQKARPYADLRARYDMELARDRSTYPSR